MIYRYLRIVNIDIAAGACANAFFFASMLGVTLDWEVYLILFNSVWIIYTLDRLLDSRIHPEMDTPRHRIHKKYAKLFILLLLLPLIANLLLMSRIDKTLILYGSLVGAIVGIYLLVIWKKWRVPKELIIAFIYTLGVALAPIILAQDMGLSTIILLVQHMLLALYNLMILSSHERQQDLNSGQTNIAVLLGRHFVQVTLLLRFVVLGLGVVFLAMGGIWEGQVILLVMMIALSLIQGNPHYFNQNERYGIWADAVFFIPVLSYFL